MSVVAWDGRLVAADRRAVGPGGLTMVVRKLEAFGEPVSGVLAVTGDYASGRAMVSWFLNGRDPARFPKCQDDDDRWARLIVIRGDCRLDPEVVWYERTPEPITCSNRYMAWGAGGDLALGAMCAGATACHAVEIACSRNAYCGDGVDCIGKINGTFRIPEEAPYREWRGVL